MYLTLCYILWFNDCSGIFVSFYVLCVSIPLLYSKFTTSVSVKLPFGFTLH